MPGVDLRSLEEVARPVVDTAARVVEETLETATGRASILGNTLREAFGKGLEELGLTEALLESLTPEEAARVLDFLQSLKSFRQLLAEARQVAETLGGLWSRPFAERLGGDAMNAVLLAVQTSTSLARDIRWLLGKLSALLAISPHLLEQMRTRFPGWM